MLNSTLILTLGCLLCAMIFYAYAKYKLSYWRRRGVKSPPASLVFGNFKETLILQKPAGLVLQEIYEAAEPAETHIGFYVFQEPRLLLRDLDLIKQMFAKDFEVFSNRCFGGSGQTDAVGLVSILSARQPLWQYLRHKLTPGMTGARLRDMMPLMRDRLEELLAYIQDAGPGPDGWTRLDFKDLASRYSTDVLASLAFGVVTSSYGKRNLHFWENGQNILARPIRGVFLIVLFFLPGLIKFIRYFIAAPAKYLRLVFRDVIETREKTGLKRGDMVDYFINLKNGEQRPDYRFESDNLLAQAESIFTAGNDSTSSVIAFTLYELACHPEHQEHLYNEIKDVLKGNELNIDTVQRMPFLDQVVNEILRLYPILPFIDRIAERNYKLPGSDIVLEKGTPVYVSLNGLNRDSKYFERPNEFIPTRSRISSDLPSSVTFGIGPRACAGQRLAVVMTKITVIGILNDYIIANDEDKEVTLKPSTVFTVAADGIHLKLKKRK